MDKRQCKQSNSWECLELVEQYARLGQLIYGNRIYPGRVGNIEYNSAIVPFCGTKMILISLSRFSIEISVSYKQNAFDNFIVSITDSPAFHGYEFC